MALSTHLRKEEMWGNFFIVTIAPSVRLASRQKAGQAPFRWYSLKLASYVKVVNVHSA